MGKVIRRVQAVSAVLMLAALGFFGVHPAMATQTEPGPGQETEQPVGPTLPTLPAVTPPVFEPEPSPSAPAPEPAAPPVDPPVAPQPVAPPVVEPAAPPVTQPIAPAGPPEVSPIPAEVEIPNYVVEPQVPAEVVSPVPTETAPTPTPTPVATQAAAPPVASADIAGPLKVALAPVSDSNPLVQGLTVLVLILLGVAYFRALRSKGVPGPRTNGK